MKARATTGVGRTKGRVLRARRASRPGKRKRKRKARGKARARVRRAERRPYWRLKR
jgi:hypothetical protein